MVQGNSPFVSPEARSKATGIGENRTPPFSPATRPGSRTPPRRPVEALEWAGAGDRCALAAADAIARPAAALGVDVVVVEGLAVVAIGPLGVEAGKQRRDVDAPGAALDAVAAGCAGNHVLPVHDVDHARKPGQLLLRQRLEGRERLDVLRHLLGGAHARQDHRHALVAAGKAQRVAGRSVRAGLGQRLGRGRRQGGQGAALDGLHDHDRLAVGAADLVAGAALDRDVVPVKVVELQLHAFDLGVLGQDLVQDLGGVVEANAKVTHAAVAYQLVGLLIGTEALVLGVALAALRVHEQQVEVLDAAGGKLLLKQWDNLLGAVEVAVGELVHQEVLVAGVAAGERLADGGLALALQVDVGGVKVVEAGGQEGVHHLAELRDIDLAVLQSRQPHAAKAEPAAGVLEGVCLRHSRSSPRGLKRVTKGQSPCHPGMPRGVPFTR